MTTRRLRTRTFDSTVGRSPLKASARPVRSPSPREGLRGLQPVIGNRRVTQLAQRVQRHLEVGAAGDRFEQEADAQADAVMRMLGATSFGPPPVQRSAGDAVVGREGGSLGPDAAQRIDRARSGGTPLPPPLRRSMEDAFGTDLGAVRTHAGPEADALSRSMQARAFTSGSDIFFAKGQFRPDTGAGQRLLAHELVHTVQQGATGGPVQRYCGKDDQAQELLGRVEAAQQEGGGAKEAQDLLSEKDALIPGGQHHAKRKVTLGQIAGDLRGFIERHKTARPPSEKKKKK